MAKTSYINTEITWLEEKIKQLRAYVDNNPFDTLEDRTEIVMSAKGTPVIKIIATKETQLKELRTILKDLPAMLADLDRLRELKEASSMEIRGGQSMGGMMEDNLNEH